MQIPKKAKGSSETYLSLIPKYRSLADNKYIILIRKRILYKN